MLKSDFIPARKNFLGELLVFWLCRNSLWRGFHSVNFRAAEPLPAPPSCLNAPVIFYSNHSSWWDGYLAEIITKQVYGLDSYLMMDVRQLRRYRFFSWAGCFSVDQEDGRSALHSLDYIARVLGQKPGRALWIFPQGYIIPQERRPPGFHTGLAHLLKRTGACYLYPVAFRFEFLAAQHPDIFIQVGRAIHFEADTKIEPKKLTLELETLLTTQLDDLRDTINRLDLASFVPIIQGKTSTTPAFNRLLSLFKKFSN